MKWNNSFIPTLKEDPQDAEIISHKLMIRSGILRKLTSGAYTYLPLGYKILDKVTEIIRQEMNKTGAQEILMPALQPVELWKKTQRDDVLGEVMIKFRDRHGKIMCLGPTHEEVVTDLVAGNTSSYRDFPFTLYQIQTKFRDELRPRFGVLRSCEFIMKDAYSFDINESGLEKSYSAMYDAYKNILSRCGLEFNIVEADSGVMGGGLSHEFMVPAGSGEDVIALCNSCGYAASKEVFAAQGKEPKNQDKCPKCGKKIILKNTIEIGHTFKLGTKYTKALSGKFLDKDSKQKDIIMGCYGIGVTRIPASLIETSHDEKGIIWPLSIAPYEVALIQLNMKNDEMNTACSKLYTDLKKSGVDLIYDNREITAGIKFAESELIGFPIQIIIGDKKFKEKKAEIKLRKGNKQEVVEFTGIKSRILDLIRENKR